MLVVILEFRQQPIKFGLSIQFDIIFGEIVLQISSLAIGEVWLLHVEYVDPPVRRNLLPAESR